MEGTTVKPALTAEEWAELPLVDDDDSDAFAPSSPDGTLLRYPGDPDVAFAIEYDGTWAVKEGRHRIAALALHGQPFGFTWEIHDALEDAVETWRAEAGFMDGDSGADVEQRREYAAMMQGLANIAALLPPREAS